MKRFVLTQAYALKDHARQMAAREGRPYQYFGERTRKEDLARQLAERDGIQDGLVAVFATVEPCRTFSLRWREGSAFIQSTRRKCLILYDYFMDRDLGLIHVRVQTWFPLQMQVYVNGHEWLARKLTRHGLRYTKPDHAFLWLEDFARADIRAPLHEPGVGRPPGSLRAAGEPVAAGRAGSAAVLLGDHPVRVRNRPGVQEPPAPGGVFSRLLEHSTLCFTAQDVMSFLRKFHVQFEGEVVT